ncbi:GntR family transcriptional regulator [Lachnospiraceae bacterium NSJ-143]|nr:GntR family transcriptional regulator [Lachnospiraceae bacterium NSJ-143]
MFEKLTYKEQAYNYLLNLIINNELESGKAYSERYFAEKMGISRTPVREAILHLAQEGYIQIHPNRGISVRELTESEIHAIFQVRTALEGYCAAFAAEKAHTSEGKDLIACLESYLEQEKKINRSKADPKEFMKNDVEFHFEMVKFCGNEIMNASMINLRNRINCIGIKSFYNAGRIDRTIDEHIKIVHAIKVGDSAKAYNAITRHFESCEEAIKQ